MKEKSLHKSVCDYLRLQYPKVMFNSDMAGAMKLTIGQAVQIKQLRSNRGFPDIVIYEARNGFNGLFLELKREGEKIFRQNGNFVSDHVAEQNDCMNELMKRGYLCYFSVGFDEAKKLIDNYLK